MLTKDGCLEYLFSRQKTWSAQTFGGHLDPTGPLRHLILEAQEAIEAWESGDKEAFKKEVSDLQILVLDVLWRGEGNVPDLIDSVFQKQNENMARIWPKCTPGEPCLHVKGPSDDL